MDDALGGVEARAPECPLNMRALLYHDVVPAGQFGESGFVSPDANIYKFDIEEFERHLAAIQSRARPAVSVFDALPGGGDALLLTFDDGGVSAIRWTAGLLERFGHRGHFFITTDYIGKPGFLSRAEIKELAARGHVIGSHSCSHPPMMPLCTADELRREWRESVAVLSDVLGSQVGNASVPSGSYSAAVGEAAVEAGVRVLFTSEPTTSIRYLNGCALIGRYSVQQGTSASVAAALAAGDIAPRLRQFVYWNLKKGLKRAGGKAWLGFRKAVLANRTRR